MNKPEIDNYNHEKIKADAQKAVIGTRETKSEHGQSLRWQAIRTNVRMRHQPAESEALPPYVKIRKETVKNVVLGIGGAIGHDSNAALNYGWSTHRCQPGGKVYSN